MNKKQIQRLNRAIRRKDKAIDEWVDKALEASDYTRNIIFRGVAHVIAKQNEYLRKSIDEEHKHGNRD